MRVVSPSLLSLQEYNLKYVDLIEEQLNEALTTYRKPVDGDNYVRRSNQRWERERGGRERERGGAPLLDRLQLRDVWLTLCCLISPTLTASRVLFSASRLQRPNVYLPVHLYGQLVHDKTGCHLLEAQVSAGFSFAFLGAWSSTVDF